MRQGFAGATAARWFKKCNNRDMNIMFFAYLLTHLLALPFFKILNLFKICDLISVYQAALNHSALILKATAVDFEI